MATPTERQTIFVDTVLAKRTNDSYVADLQNNSNGVKSNNCFRDLQYFSLIGSQPPDLMHDFLEGTLVYNFKCLIEDLLANKILIIDRIHSKLKEFVYGKNDRENKVPVTLFRKKNFKTDCLKMSASAMWTLIRIFPLLFGLALKSNEKYLHFCNLIEIFRKLNGHSFTEEQIIVIENEIKTYLEKFALLYPNRNITAKQHFMIHYGFSIREFGPPYSYSTMRYESKHSYFKELYHSTKNRKNLTKTLSYKHQRLQLFYLMSQNYVVDSVLGSNSADYDLDIVETILGEENLLCIKTVKYKGVLYKLNDIIYHRSGFKRIVKIISCRNGVQLFVDELVVIEYLPHMTGYSLLETERLNNAIKLEELEFVHPIDLYHVRGLKIVIPKFPID